MLPEVWESFGSPHLNELPVQRKFLEAGSHENSIKVNFVFDDYDSVQVCKFV
jgi:hypothetical protein